MKRNELRKKDTNMICLKKCYNKNQMLLGVKGISALTLGWTVTGMVGLPKNCSYAGLNDNLKRRLNDTNYLSLYSVHSMHSH